MAARFTAKAASRTTATNKTKPAVDAAKSFVSYPDEETARRLPSSMLKKAAAEAEMTAPSRRGEGRVEKGLLIFDGQKNLRYSAAKKLRRDYVDYRACSEAPLACLGVASHVGEDVPVFLVDVGVVRV